MEKLATTRTFSASSAAAAEGDETQTKAARTRAILSKAGTRPSGSAPRAGRR